MEDKLKKSCCFVVEVSSLFSTFLLSLLSKLAPLLLLLDKILSVLLSKILPLSVVGV